jgi:hypothetical protein
MKYNIGDEVEIQSMDWINVHKKQKSYLGIPIGDCVSCGAEVMIEDMFVHAGATAIIVEKFPKGRYLLDVDGGEWTWTAKMFVEPTVAQLREAKDA